MAFAAPSPAANCAPPAGLHHTRVQYVIDGDTIVLEGGRHIRIVGLNAPELGHHGEPDQPFARAARKKLEKLIEQARGRVGWRTAPERHDHYGRTLAHVYANGIDVSRALIEAGLAAVIAIPPNVRRDACYIAAEKTARRHRRGLWAPGSPLVHEANEPAAARVGFEIIRGRVTHVAVKHAGTLLTLDKTITVWIEADDRATFGAMLKHIAGRRVLTRGWLNDYHGRPEIIAHRPATLTVLARPNR
jgi:endonuclease YncB( thermonuclease family)